VENKRGYTGVQKEGGGSSKNKCGLGKTQKQKGEKVLQSKRVEKARTQSERQKGEKVPQNI
jgi:hypothetical protein